MSGLPFTKTQRRLLYEVIRNVQPLYKGVDVKKQGDRPLNYSPFIEKIYTIPIKDILSEGNHNYNEFKESLVDMVHKMVLVKDDGRDFYTVSFVDFIHIPEGSGNIRIRMTTSFYQMMANIARGISVYDIDTIKKFPSLYTMNMYEYITRWDVKPPRYISLEELRTLTGVNEVVQNETTKKQDIKRKFQNAGDFEKSVLQVAKTQMDDPQYACAYKFDYERVKKGKRIVGYNITVYKDAELLTDQEKRYDYKKTHDAVVFELSQPVIQKLKDIGFDYAGMRSNMALLRACEKVFPNFLALLSTLHGQVREKAMKKELEKTPQAYVIGSLKKMLEMRGIEVKPDGTIITGKKKISRENRRDKTGVPNAGKDVGTLNETPDLFSSMLDIYADKLVNKEE